MSCVFCDVAEGVGPAVVLRETGACLVIAPLGPVTPGHVLVIPRVHVADAAERPEVTAMTAQVAALWARDAGAPFNLITSAGVAATQTVRHLHIHYVPRADGDGLALPWSAAS